MSAGPRAWGSAAALLVATSLSAQTLPLPALPRQDAEPPRPRQWEYAVGAGFGWDGNVEFLAPGGPRGVAFVPRGSLARFFRGPQSRARAWASGDWTGYPSERIDRYQVDMGVEGTHRASPTTTWRAHASYGVGHTDSTSILAAQGVSLPLAAVRTLAAGGSLTRSGRRTSVRFDGRFHRVGFEGAGLIDGASVRAEATVEHRRGPRDTVAVGYAAEDVLSGGQDASYLSHFGSARWSRVLTPRSALLLEAGASYTPGAARAGLEGQASFYGGASFTHQRDGSSVVLFLRREVAPAFGLGLSRLDLRAGLAATLGLGRSGSLRMAATRVRPDTPAGSAEAHSTSTEAFAALGRRLGRHFELSGEARYRRRGAAGALPAVEGFSAGLFVMVVSPSAPALQNTTLRP